MPVSAVAGATGQGENESEYQFATTRKTIDENNSRNGGSRKWAVAVVNGWAVQFALPPPVFSRQAERRRGTTKGAEIGEGGHDDLHQQPFRERIEAYGIAGTSQGARHPAIASVRCRTRVHQGSHHAVEASNIAASGMKATDDRADVPLYRRGTLLPVLTIFKFSVRRLLILCAKRAD
jgi:hypothetical protein